MLKPRDFPRDLSNELQWFELSLQDPFGLLDSCRLDSMAQQNSLGVSLLSSNKLCSGLARPLPNKATSETFIGCWWGFSRLWLWNLPKNMFFGDLNHRCSWLLWNLELHSVHFPNFPTQQLCIWASITCGEDSPLSPGAAICTTDSQTSRKACRGILPWETRKADHGMTMATMETQE